MCIARIVYNEKKSTITIDLMQGLKKSLDPRDYPRRVYLTVFFQRKMFYVITVQVGSYICSAFEICYTIVNDLHSIMDIHVSVCYRFVC